MYRCYMKEYIHEPPPIDRHSKYVLRIARILHLLADVDSNFNKPEVASSVELVDVLVGGKLMDVTRTTVPRGSRANDLEKTIVAAEAPLAVVAMAQHPAYRGRKIVYWVADRLGGGELRRTVIIRDSSVSAGGEGLPGLVLTEDDVPLAALFLSGGYSMATPGVFNCDAVALIAQPPSPDSQLDGIMSQITDSVLLGTRVDTQMMFREVMESLPRNKRG